MIREPDFELRVGKITSSNLYRLWGKKTSRLTYANQIRDELEHPEKYINRHNPPPEHMPASLRWGVEVESRARGEYGFRHQCDIKVPRFKVSPDRDYFGSSIDGLRHTTPRSSVTVSDGDEIDVRLRNDNPSEFIAADNYSISYATRGLEIKCCWLETEHLKTLRDGIPRKHNMQIYGELHCYELEVVDFVAYDPRRNHPEDYKEWPVRRDTAIEMVLLAEIDRFWDFVIGHGHDTTNAPVEVPRFF